MFIPQHITPLSIVCLPPMDSFSALLKTCCMNSDSLPQLLQPYEIKSSSYPISQQHLTQSTISILENIFLFQTVHWPNFSPTILHTPPQSLTVPFSSTWLLGFGTFFFYLHSLSEYLALISMALSYVIDSQICISSPDHSYIPNM